MKSTCILLYLLPFLLLLVDLVAGTYGTQANHRSKREAVDEQPKKIEEQTLGLNGDHERTKRGWWNQGSMSSACSALCGMGPVNYWRGFGGWGGGGGGGGGGGRPPPVIRPPVIRPPVIEPPIWPGGGNGCFGGNCGFGGGGGGGGGWGWKRRR